MARDSQTPEAEMTVTRRDKILSAIWTAEIELDAAMCRDGGESEEVAELAEGFLEDITRLRKRLIKAFGASR